MIAVGPLTSAADDFPQGIDGKRWAQRAHAIPYHQLADARASAQQWRNGLAGLIALFSVGSLIVSPTLAERLPPIQRDLVGALLLAGLFALIIGTWWVMGASFGIPGKERPLTDRQLYNWERTETLRALRAITVARYAFILAVLLIIAAVGTAYFDAPAEGASVVRLQVGNGSICGHLKACGAGTAFIVAPDGHTYILPIALIPSLAPAASCHPPRHRYGRHDLTPRPGAG